MIRVLFMRNHRHYVKGEIYELPRKVAKALISRGIAKEVTVENGWEKH